MSLIKNNLQIGENLNRPSAFRKSDDFDWQLAAYSQRIEIISADLEPFENNVDINFRTSSWQTSTLIAAMLIAQQQLSAASAKPVENCEIYLPLAIAAKKFHNRQSSSRFVVPQFDTKPLVMAGEQKIRTDDNVQLETIFNGLVKTWKEGTAGYSITTRRYAHGSYQAILVLGKDVVPLVLRELQNRPDWWFEALKALTKADPTKPTDNFHDAVKAWLQWGKEQNLILK